MEVILIPILITLSVFVSLFSGFSLLTIMMPLTVLFFPFKESLLIVGVVHLFRNFLKVSLIKNDAHFKLIKGFAVPAMMAAFIASVLLVYTKTAGIERLLGLFLLPYVSLLMVNPKLEISTTESSTFFAGLISGFVSGFLGVGGAIRSAMIAAYNFPEATFITSNWLISVLVDVVRIGTYLFFGLSLSKVLLLTLLSSLPLVILGEKLAIKLSNKFSQRQFRIITSIFLLLLSFKLLFF